jgi:hypothetical protein
MFPAACRKVTPTEQSMSRLAAGLPNLTGYLTPSGASEMHVTGYTIFVPMAFKPVPPGSFSRFSFRR